MRREEEWRKEAASADDPRGKGERERVGWPGREEEPLYGADLAPCSLHSPVRGPSQNGDEFL